MAEIAQGLTHTDVKGGNTRHLVYGLIIAGALVLAPGFASAAKLFVAPAAGSYAVDRMFPVTIRVNTEGTAINATEGTLAFNPSVLQVVSLSTAGSIFNVDVQQPDFSNTAGTVRWAGVMLNPGFTGPSGKLLTVNFRSVAQGTGGVSFASAAVLANDGHGTNVLDGTSGGTYVIGPVGSPGVSPAVSNERPQASSTTDPVTVRIAYGFLHDWVPWLALLAALALLIWAARYFWAAGPLRGSGTQVDGKLQLILEDMDSELALLSRVAKHRPLYPEEQYLRSKLMQYRRNLKLLHSDTHSRLVKKK